MNVYSRTQFPGFLREGFHSAAPNRPNAGPRIAHPHRLAPSAVRLQTACSGVVRPPFGLFSIVVLYLIKSNFAALFGRILNCAGPGEHIKGSLVLNGEGGASTCGIRYAGNSLPSV